MKKILVFVTVLAAFYGCTSNDYVGNEALLPTEESLNGAIVFSTSADAITRANLIGADAAKKLNKNFVVEGIKTVSSTKAEVFDNYNVNWKENTAGTTTSNSANWEYVGETKHANSAVSEQSIKYWDWSASQYDFWAYSLGGGSATVSSLAHDAALGTNAYTVTGSLEDLGKVYISDLVTAYNPTQTSQPEFGKQVSLNFRSLVTKVRVGFYETIPGWSVRDVKFYASNTATAPATDNSEKTATLYATDNNLPSIAAGAASTATYTVTFPTTGSGNTSKADYNQAHVTFKTEGGTKTSTATFGTLNYGAKETGKYEKTTGNVWLGRSSSLSDVTWANSTADATNHYFTVLPNEAGEVLTLKVDYTLESTDGTGETITVHGATALIPSQFTKWKPNYAYTYLFKISDNTNGKTNPGVDVSGLYPITFDAVVVGSEEGTQETITTVATPSITTYSLTSDVTTNNEYKTSDDIYVTATTDGTFIDMTGKATLYKVTKPSVTSFTEAEVLAALNKYSSETTGTYLGRNGITLAPVSGGLSLAAMDIPLVDGNKITGLTAGQVALIDKSKLEANNIYAFVYETTTGTATTTDKYEAVKPASGTDVSKYYTDNTGATLATGTADGSTTYYDKYTETNKTYAIKVLKVK